MTNTEVNLGGKYAFHVDGDYDPTSGEKARGNSTASPLNVRYRVGEVAQYLRYGTWLDYGCADGGYTEGLLEAGAKEVIGVDVESARTDEATRRQIPYAHFLSFDGHTLPFPDASFDGAFVNETMEHVYDEKESLAELHRVIKQGGILVVISPNRWFPIEGHTTRIGSWTFPGPAPFVPWLPKRWTKNWVDARNYWPTELRSLVRDNGFNIEKVSWIWPVFEVLPWLPAGFIKRYQKYIRLYAHIPLIARFGVSNLVVGRRA